MTYRLKDFKDAILEHYNQNPEAQYTMRISGAGFSEQVFPGVTPPELPAGIYDVTVTMKPEKGSESVVFSGTVEVPETALARKRDRRRRGGDNGGLDLGAVFERLEEKRIELDAKLEKLNTMSSTMERSFLKEMADENDRRWERRFTEEQERASRSLDELKATHQMQLDSQKRLHEMEMDLKSRYQQQSPNVERERIKQETRVKTLEFFEPFKEPIIQLTGFGLTALLERFGFKSSGGQTPPPPPET
jgi:hypothetical protein